MNIEIGNLYYVKRLSNLSEREILTMENYKT